MSGSRLVYSTCGGRVRQPNQPPTTPDRSVGKPSIPNDGVVRIFRERGGRNGKVVTVVRGLPPGAALLDLAAGAAWKA